MLASIIYEAPGGFWVVWLRLNMSCESFCITFQVDASYLIIIIMIIIIIIAIVIL